MVEGYETESQRAARLKREAAERERQARDSAEQQEARVRSLIPGTLERLRATMEPNCMIELVKTKGLRVVATLPGWYLGKVTASEGSYVSSGHAEPTYSDVYLALGQDGVLYVHPSFGIRGDPDSGPPPGPRREFRVPVEGWRNKRRDVFEYFGQAHYLARLADLLEDTPAGANSQ